MLSRLETPVRPVTSGPKHHFFGYYDKLQFDPTGTKMLCLEVDFMDRPPGPDDAAGICVVDMANGNRLERVAETTAWCWQQGCMLQWLPSAPDRKIIFNVRLDDRYGSCVMDVETGEKRVYDRPVYCVSHDGRFAMSANFSRIAVTRPGYGYVGFPDPWHDEDMPADDGICRLDLETGESRLIVPLARIAEFDNDPPGLKRYFNHLLIAPDSRRFIFLYRTIVDSMGGLGRKTRFFTANVDGGDICCLNDQDMTSHFIWRDPDTILAWARRFEEGDHYYLFKDRTGEYEAMSPDILTCDGHMSYRPQADWFVSDTYPGREDSKRELFIFHPETETRVSLGRYFADPKYAGEIRCDLHPRWSPDGRLITFDSLHEGTRQVYAVDVSGIVG